MATKRSSSLPVHHAALKRMLRPLVRYWLRNFDTIQSFVDILKLVFVEEAVSEIEKNKAKVNVSKISVVTGIHRIDVTKIYKEEEDFGHNVPDVVSRVIGRWQSHPDFTTKDGKPRVISFGNDSSEFVELVKSESKAVSPGSVLFELERAKAVKKTDKGLSLIRPTFRVTRDFAKVTDVLAKDVETLITAVEENANSKGDESPNHHIRTEYDNIYLKDIPKIRAWLRREGKRFHKKVRDYLSKYDKDISDKPEDAGAKVSMSGFSFITLPSEEGASGTENRKMKQ